MEPLNLTPQSRAAVDVLKSALSYLAEQKLPPTPENYAQAYASVTGESPLLQAAPSPRAAVEALCSFFEFENLVGCAVSGRPFESCPEMHELETLSLEALCKKVASTAERRRNKARSIAQTIETVVCAVDDALTATSEGLVLARGLQRETDAPATERKVSNLQEAADVIQALQDQLRRMSQGLGEVTRALSESEARLQETRLKLQVAESERDTALDKALRDPLTQLLNRRGLEFEVSRSRGGAVLLIDLDDFKRINDTRGHAAGDQVLVRFADVVRANLRSSDRAGRTGGEEFLLFFPGTSKAEAAAVGHRILNAFRRAQQLEGLSSTFSAGVAGLSQDNATADQLSDAIAQADTHLYRAKAAGKGRIEPKTPLD